MPPKVSIFALTLLLTTALQRLLTRDFGADCLIRTWLMRSFFNPFQRKRATETDEDPSTTRAKRSTKASAKVVNESEVCFSTLIVHPARDASPINATLLANFPTNTRSPSQRKLKQTAASHLLLKTLQCTRTSVSRRSFRLMPIPMIPKSWAPKASRGSSRRRI